MLTRLMPLASVVLTLPDKAIGGERKRSFKKGVDDEEDDGNSAFCRAAPGFDLCRHPRDHPLTERFPAKSERGKPFGHGVTMMRKSMATPRSAGPRLPSLSAFIRSVTP